VDNPTVLIAMVLALGIVAQWVATQLKVPSILLLLAVGLAAGPGFGLIDPDDLLGDLLFPVVSMGVGLLLFEGGLGLHKSEFGRWRKVLVRLLSVGVLITGLVGAAAAYYVGGLPARVAAVFGALMTVTGPTVIIPLLRQARLRPRLARVLRWEGITIDAVGATLGVVVLEVVAVEGEGPFQIAAEVASTAVIGTAIGFIMAVVVTRALAHHWVPDHIQNGLILAAVFVAFAVSNELRSEAGLFATTVMGITMANQRRAPVRHVVEFQENLSVMLIGSIFVLLGARVEADSLRDNLLPALGVLAVLVLVARPLAVAVSTWRSNLSRNERMYLGALAPRGIVAASVSALFALRLEANGVEGGADLAAFTFVVVAGSVVIYGLLARPVSRWLHVAVPDPTGVALIGAPAWAVSLGVCLSNVDVAVLVVSTDEEEIEAARRADLLVYNGRLAHRDLVETTEALGVGLALAVSGREELNQFGAERFMALIGRSNVYSLPLSSEERDEAHGGAGGQEVRLFGAGLTNTDLASLLESGAEMVTIARSDLRSPKHGFWPIISTKGGTASVINGGVDEAAEWVIGLQAPITADEVRVS